MKIFLVCEVAGPEVSDPRLVSAGSALDAMRIYRNKYGGRRAEVMAAWNREGLSLFMRPEAPDDMIRSFHDVIQRYITHSHNNRINSRRATSTMMEWQREQSEHDRKRNRSRQLGGYHGVKIEDIDDEFSDDRSLVERDPFDRLPDRDEHPRAPGSFFKGGCDED